MFSNPERVSLMPQMNHHSEDENIALVDSTAEPSHAGVLLVPEYENIVGRINDVDSYLMAARESILADSDKPSSDENLPYTGTEPAFAHDIMHESSETTHAERPISLLSRYERSSTEEASSRDHTSIASMSSIHEASNTSSGSTRASAETSGTPALLSTQVEYPAAMELDESSYPSSPHAPEWSTMVVTDPDIDLMNPEYDHTSGYGDFNSLRSKPNLVDATPSIVRVSVMELLGAARSDDLFRKLNDRALRKIELLADLFEAAQAFEDAYQLRRLVLLQAIHIFEQDRLSENPWGSRVAHVIKDASTVIDSEEALQFYKKALSKDPSLDDEMSQIGMLQQSYVGSLYRKKGSSCESYCRRALQRTLLHPTKAFQKEAQFTLATQLTALASIDISQEIASESFQSPAFWREVFFF